MKRRNTTEREIYGIGDPNDFRESLDQAEELLGKGCEAIDGGRFWRGVGLGLTGLLGGLLAIARHPIEACRDLLAPEDEPEAKEDEPEDEGGEKSAGKRNEP